MLNFLNRFGIVVTRLRNVDPEQRMNVVLQRMLSGVDLVVDVGANSGQTYTRVRNLGYSGRYLAIEPESKSFQQLALMKQNDNKLFCVNKAIGKQIGTVVLNVANNDSLSSSLLNFSEGHLRAAPGIKMVSKQEVLMVPLSLILDEYVDRSIFLKIDVQGLELGVLQGVIDRDWVRISGLLIECNLVATYKGSALVEEVIAFLRQRSLTPFRIENGFGEVNFGQQLQVDVLFKNS